MDYCMLAHVVLVWYSQPQVSPPIWFPSQGSSSNTLFPPLSPVLSELACYRRTGSASVFSSKRTMEIPKAVSHL